MIYDLVHVVEVKDIIGAALVRVHKQAREAIDAQFHFFRNPNNSFEQGIIKSSQIKSGNKEINK